MRHASPEVLEKYPKWILFLWYYYDEFHNCATVCTGIDLLLQQHFAPLALVLAFNSEDRGWQCLVLIMPQCLLDVIATTPEVRWCFGKVVVWYPTMIFFNTQVGAGGVVTAFFWCWKFE